MILEKFLSACRKLSSSLRILKKKKNKAVSNIKDSRKALLSLKEVLPTSLLEVN